MNWRGRRIPNENKKASDTVIYPPFQLFLGFFLAKDAAAAAKRQQKKNKEEEESKEKGEDRETRLDQEMVHLRSIHVSLFNPQTHHLIVIDFANGSNHGVDRDGRGSVVKELGRRGRRTGAAVLVVEAAAAAAAAAATAAASASAAVGLQVAAPGCKKPSLFSSYMLALRFYSPLYSLPFTD